MPTNFPYVKVPVALLPIIGERVGDSRVYRKRGPEEEVAAWYETISDFAGPSVSPGGVLMYCPVSRAAVYKRIKEGKLTAFNYFVTKRKTRFFGGLVTFREMPYCYIPVSEAKAWRKELEERAIAQGIITAEELEGLRPDPDDDFLAWNSKWQRAQRKRGGEK